MPLDSDSLGSLRIDRSAAGPESGSARKWIIVIAVLVVLGALGIGGWLLFGRSTPEVTTVVAESQGSGPSLGNSVLNASGYGVWEYNLATHKLEWDDHLLEIYGVKRSDLSGTLAEWEARIHPDDLPRIQQEADQALRGRTTQHQNQFRIRRPDGSERFISSHRYLLRGADGSLTGFGGGLERKRWLLTHEGAFAAQPDRAPLQGDLL